MKNILQKLSILALVVLATAAIGYGQSCPAPGCLDTSFGGGDGMATVYPPALPPDVKLTYFSAPLDSVALSDGKIVYLFGARTSAPTQEGIVPRSALLRLNSDGTPDTSFGVRGDGWVFMAWDSATVTTPPLHWAGAMSRHWIGNDEGFVFVGQSRCGSTVCTRVERYTYRGIPDANFGQNGVTVLNSAKVGHPGPIAVGNDGKIVVGGNFDSFARLNADGTPDSTFGPGGVSNVNTGFLVHNILVLPNGRILASGITTNKGGNDDFVIGRFNVNGSIDDGKGKDLTPGDSFGSGGRRTFDFAGASDSAGRFAVDPFDGRIIISGYATTGGYNRAALACATSSGAVCSDFGTNGKVALNLTSGTESGGFGSVAIQSDPRNLNNYRKIVALGSGSINGAPADVLVARFGITGALDQSFGNSGLLLLDYPGNAGTFGLIQKDPFCDHCEKIIVNGNFTFAPPWVVMRLLP